MQIVTNDFKTELREGNPWLLFAQNPVAHSLSIRYLTNPLIYYNSQGNLVSKKPFRSVHINSCPQKIERMRKALEVRDRVDLLSNTTAAPRAIKTISYTVRVYISVY